jgi:hypothetical protein
MSDEILYLIIFIITMSIISNVCNICIKKIVLYIIIILIIIYFINYINYRCNINEPFIGSVSNLCNIVKDKFNDVVNKTSSKCPKDEDKFKEKESRQHINDAVDCYNFTGNEIVSSNNVSSWCDLNSVDIDIINNAIKTI